MRELFIRSLRPPGQLWFLLLIFTISNALFVWFGAYVVLNIFGIDVSQSGAALMEFKLPYSAEAAKLLLAIQHIGLYVLPALLFNQIFSVRRKRSFIFWGEKPAFTKVVMILLLMIASIPVVNFIAALNEKMVFPEFLKWLEEAMRNSEEQIAKFTELLLNVQSIWGYLANLFIIAILPALGEEFLFRGVIQKIVTRWTGKVHLSIWLVAAIFSAMHMQFYGFFPRMLLGAMFGYIMIWSGSIWYSVIAHFINNAVTLTLAYFIQNGQIEKEVDEVTSLTEYLPAFGIGLAVAGIMLWYLHRISVFEKYKLDYITHPKLVIKVVNEDKIQEEPEEEDPEEDAEQTKSEE